jgi:hypothetical protein
MTLFACMKAVATHEQRRYSKYKDREITPFA